MSNHRVIVARGFRIGGWMLGVPSLAALVAVCVSLFSPRPAADNSAYLDIGTYGIAGLLADGARGVGNLFAWLGGVGSWIEEAIAIGLLGIVLSAAVLYFTGRGIERHSTPARIVALAIAFVFLLFWLVVLLCLPRNTMALPGLGVGVSLYALWVLCWRYA